MENRHQRKGALSNSHAGREFEAAAHMFFEKNGIKLQRDYAVQVGHHAKKYHKFDLGSTEPPILVECKSYTWTETGGSPSAKIRGINEAMLLFSVAPSNYKKILFLLKHSHARQRMTLASHYLNTQGHLVPPGVEVWEMDVSSGTAEKLR